MIHIIIQQSHDGVESIGPCFVHREHAVAAAEKVVERRQREDAESNNVFVKLWKRTVLSSGEVMDTWDNGLYEVTVWELPVNEGPIEDDDGSV